MKRVRQNEQLIDTVPRYSTINWVSLQYSSLSSLDLQQYTRSIWNQRHWNEDLFNATN